VARYQAGIRTEARIIDATRSLLAEGGLEAATLKAICDRAEVKAGSFYNLFDSKAALTRSTISSQRSSGSSRRNRRWHGSM
jgi:AcrR family transcriptional regulator